MFLGLVAVWLGLRTGTCLENSLLVQPAAGHSERRCVVRCSQPGRAGLAAAPGCARLAPVSRVHGSALSLALKSPLGLAKSSQQHGYRVMLQIDPAGCDVGPWPGRLLISDRQPGRPYDLCCCAAALLTSYGHHDTGIQQLRDIACFITSECVAQLSVQGQAGSRQQMQVRWSSLHEQQRAEEWMCFPCAPQHAYLLQSAGPLPKCWGLSVLPLGTGEICNWLQLFRGTSGAEGFSVRAVWMLWGTCIFLGKEILGLSVLSVYVPAGIVSINKIRKIREDYLIASKDLQYNQELAS